MHPAETALKQLIDAGYATQNQNGWVAIVHPPKPKDLHWFVKAISTLASWSVSTTHGAATIPARVERSTGSEPHQILFRLKLENI